MRIPLRQCQPLVSCFYLVFLFTSLLHFSQLAASIRWLALSHAKHSWNESRHCPQTRQSRKAYGLVGFQTKLCKRHVELMPSIMKAVIDTLHVCQIQFTDRRWNCTSIQFAPRLTADLTKGTREQAFVYSLSSASVAHGIAKACSSGQLNYCPCGPMPNDVGTDFKWKGCSDNVQYGVRVSEEWADSPWRHKNRRRSVRDLSRLTGFLRTSRYVGKERASGTASSDINYLNSLTPRARMNQHNNDVGRLVVSNSLESKCKCHGVSGSCSMKTCWKVVPDLVKIGEILKAKYTRALEVRARSQNTPKVELEPVTSMGRVAGDALVFLRKSPDYCTEDRRVGSLGTRGSAHILVPAAHCVLCSPHVECVTRPYLLGRHWRNCNASMNSHSGCDSMCCGRGFETYEMEVISNCECRYVHCCEVICKKCHEMVKKHYCK